MRSPVSHGGRQRSVWAVPFARGALLANRWLVFATQHGLLTAACRGVASARQDTSGFHFRAASFWVMSSGAF